MRRLLSLLALTLITVPVLSQYRDTVVVDNAVFKRLSQESTDTFLTIDRAGVVHYIYMPPASYKDSIFWKPGNVTTPSKWIKSGDTVGIDTTFIYVIDTVNTSIIIIGGDTLTGLDQLRDSIYFMPGTFASAAGYLLPGDTLFIDTTSSAVVDQYWQRSGGLLRPIDLNDSIGVGEVGWLAPAIVYGNNNVSNGDFESYKGAYLETFTGWYDNSTTAGYIDTADGHSGRYSVKLYDGGTATAAVSQSGISLSASLTYRLSFWHKGDAGLFYLVGTNYFNASTGAWGLYPGNPVPASVAWKEYHVDFTPPTTRTYALSLAQETNGKTIYFDDVVIATYQEHMSIEATKPLHINGSSLLIKTLPGGASDTALLISNDTIYKGLVTTTPDTFNISYTGSQRPGVVRSGDTIFITIDYDSVAAYIDIDSLITTTVLDSIITSLNIDSSVSVTVIAYLDTSTRLVDTFQVVYGNTQVPGIVRSGDAIHIDTTKQTIDTFGITDNTLSISLSHYDSTHNVDFSKYIDTLYIDYCNGCALTSGMLLSGNTIYIDTSRRTDTIFSTIITTDTLVSIIIQVDTIYLGGDTVTTAEFLWRKGQGGVNNARLRTGSSYISGNHSIVTGTLDTVTGHNSFASGWWAKASGLASLATGYATQATEVGAMAGGSGNATGGLHRVTASGVASFNYSYIDSTTKTSNASGVASAVLGSVNSSATGTGTVVLGMKDHTGTAAYTTYVQDLMASGRVHYSDSVWTEDYFGYLYGNSGAGHLWAIGDTPMVFFTRVGVYPGGTALNIDLGRNSQRFKDLYLYGTAHMDKIQIHDNAADGRVLISDPSGFGEWAPISELTGTKDTFHVTYSDGSYPDGWLESGDSIWVTNHWQRSGGRVMPLTETDTVGVGEIGHLTWVSDTIGGLIDFENFIEFDGAHPVFSKLPYLADSVIFDVSGASVIDTVPGKTGSYAMQLIKGATGEVFFMPIFMTNGYNSEKYSFTLEFWYKGKGSVDIINQLGNSYIFATHEWEYYPQCSSYNLAFYEIESVEWAKFSYTFPLSLNPYNCTDLELFQLYITTNESTGDTLIIDDVLFYATDNHLNIISDNSLHLTPHDGLLIRNLPTATGDTVLTISNDTIYKTLMPTAGDTSHWEVSGSSIYPKSTAAYLGLGKTNPAYRLDLTGDAMISNRAYWGGTNCYAQDDGTGVLFLAGYGGLTFSIAGGSKYRFRSTYFEPVSNNTFDLGRSSTRWKNIYAGTYIYTPKIELTNLATNTTSADVLVLDGTDVQKRTNIAFWYKGTGASSYMSRSDGVASATNSIAIGYRAEATGTGSLSGGNTTNITSFETKATGFGAFNWQQGGFRSITSGLGAATLGGYQNYNEGLFSVILGGAGNTINGRSNPMLGGSNFIAACTTAVIDSAHVGAAIIASYEGESVADYTLHTDNLHVFDTGYIPLLNSLKVETGNLSMNRCDRGITRLVRRLSIDIDSCHNDYVDIDITAEMVNISQVLRLKPMDDLPEEPPNPLGSTVYLNGMLVNHNGVLKFYNGTAWKTISFDP